MGSFHVDERNSQLGKRLSLPDRLSPHISVLVDHGKIEAYLQNPQSRRHSTGALVSPRVSALNAFQKTGLTTAMERPTLRRISNSAIVVSEKARPLDKNKENLSKELENRMHTAIPTKADDSQHKSFGGYELARREGSHRRQNSRPRKSTDSASSFKGNLDSPRTTDTQLAKKPPRVNASGDTLKVGNSLCDQLPQQNLPSSISSLNDNPVSKELQPPGVNASVDTSKIVSSLRSKLRQQNVPSTTWMDSFMRDLLNFTCCARQTQRSA